jgi:hypothetical protein
MFGQQSATAPTVRCRHCCYEIPDENEISRRHPGRVNLIPPSGRPLQKLRQNAESVPYAASYFLRVSQKPHRYSTSPNLPADRSPR